MRNKFTVVFFAIFFAVLVSASFCYGADALHPKTTFKLDRAPKFMIPYERGPIPPAASKGTIPLNAFYPPATDAAGYVAGITTYDYQHNGSMGRQVAYDAVHEHVFFVWMAQENFTIPGDRHIRAQAYDAALADPNPQNHLLLGVSGTNETDPDYAGYTSCAIAPGGTSAFGCHTDRGTGIYHTSFYWDSWPVFYIFDYEDCNPDPSADWYQEETIWPILGVHCSDSTGVTEDVIYLITHVFEGSEDLILYKRIGPFSDTTIHFDQGMYIETVTDLSYTIVPHPHSDSVAIVYTDDRWPQAEGDGGQVDLDVYYMASGNQGVTWGAPVNVSNYLEEDSLWRAYADLSAVFCDDGALHIIWPARQLRDANTYENYKCRLMHWDHIRKQTSIIDEARYDVRRNNVLCDPGAWNLYIAKPSVSQCEGKLYALYTKFGDDNEPQALFDCSQQNYINGELYVAASDDWGLTWDTAWNITKTRSPGCDSTECESDHWSSMSRYGVAYGDAAAMDTLDIMYINDRDAGGIPQGEGTWCVNNVMHYRFGCRAVAHIPKVSLEPNEFVDPTHTQPGVALPVTLKISNIGNEIMNIQGVTLSYITTPHPEWITIGSYSTPVATNSYTDVDITLNAGGVIDTLNGYADPSGWEAYIIVDTDAPSDKDTVMVHLTVSSIFYEPEWDTLFSTSKKLMVYNTARLGGDNDFASMDIANDCDNDLTQPNGALYLYDASPMMAWNSAGDNLAYTTIFTQLYTEVGTFRPQDTLHWSTEADYNKVTTRVSTTDSLFGVDIELYAPTDGNDFIIAKYLFYSWQGVRGADQVYVGMILDWDIPADEAVDNAPGYNETLNTVWQRGVQTDSSDEEAPHSCEITENMRYGGVAMLTAAPRNAWTAENAPMQFGSGMDPDSLYNRMTGPTGYTMYSGTGEDTVIDLHTGVTFDVIDLSGTDTTEFAVALVTSNSVERGEADYLAQVAAARPWAVDHGIIVDFVCDCEPGDANKDGSVNVGDAVYVINYVFKKGPTPTPYPICSGDPNNDGACNVGDAVYVINFVFKKGPAPVTCEAWVDTNGQPLRK